MDISQALTEHGWPGAFFVGFCFCTYRFAKWAKPLVEGIAKAHIALVESLTEHVNEDSPKIAEIHKHVVEGDICKTDR